MKKFLNVRKPILNNFADACINHRCVSNNSLPQHFWKKCIKTITALVAINAQVSPLYAAKNELYFVETIAGDGISGSVDNVATKAEFGSPIGATIDPLGNLFVSEFGNNRIRKITQSLNVSTFIGNGSSAVLSAPYSSVFDTLGNLYVSESGNNRISKITPSGVRSTLAGSGVAGFADAAGTSAQFSEPRGIIIDSLGNLYVADAQNYRIRKITTDGVVSTFAGSGTAGFANGTGTSAQFNVLRGITIDNANNLFVLDRGNSCIRKITTGGVVSTFAGSGIAGFADGTGTAPRFNSPAGITIDPFNNLYVTDSGRIRKITSSGVVSTLAGDGTAGFSDAYGLSAKFNLPIGIAFSRSGALYVTDSSNNRIRSVTPNYISSGVLDTFSTSADYGTEAITLAGGTLKPTTNGIILSNDIKLKANSILDLNGKALTLSGSIASSNGSYTLSITDSSSGGSLSYGGNTYTASGSIIFPFDLNGNNTTLIETNFPLMGNIISSSGSPDLTIDLTTTDKTITTNVLDPIRNLIKTGPNALILSGTGNTYSGMTTINDGALVGNTNSKIALVATPILPTAAIAENVFLNIQNGVDILTNGGVVGTGQSQPWTQYTYSYTATSKMSHVNFNFRQDLNEEYLDSVSVTRQGDTTNLLTNGDFETSDLAGWTRISSSSFSFSSSANTGAYAYADGTNGRISQLTQSFATTPGQAYTFSFSFKNAGGSSQQFIASMGRIDLTTPAYYLSAQNQTLTILNSDADSVIGLRTSPTDATARTLTLNNTAPLTLEGTIVGAGDLVIAGSSTVALSGTNTYTGGTSLNSGTLSISDAANIGLGALKFNGGILQILGTFGSVFTLSQDINLIANSVINTGGRSLVLSGDVTGDFGLSFIGGGSVQFGPGCAYTGQTLFDSNTTLIGSVPLSSSSYPIFNIEADQKYTEQGYLSGPSALVKDGAGELLLQNTAAAASQNNSTYAQNNYEGGTIIRNGTLTLEDNTQLPTAGITTIIFDGTNALSNKGSGTHTVGTPILKSGGVNLTTLSNTLVLASSGAIDTQLNALELTGNLSGAGDFYKVGDNELALNGTSSGERGSTNIKGGSLAVKAASLGNSRQVNISSGTLHVTETMTSNRVIRFGGQ
ncbi:MAG: autotransporter-associated beta strand repeat-containing protein [Candidatus Paracaedibacteraceae bacterium]|nr:autotransporter-associated beta strand repeat-containing protein [Candidatus Paracaedibacteraceae bacterium]